MCDTRLADVRAFHVDVGLHALLLQVLDLSDLLEDVRLIGLVAFDRETRRVVAAVLHALETIDEGLENEAAVLENEPSVSCVGKERSSNGSRSRENGLDATDPFAEEGCVGKDAAPVFMDSSVGKDKCKQRELGLHLGWILLTEREEVCAGSAKPSRSRRKPLLGMFEPLPPRKDSKVPR